MLGISDARYDFYLVTTSSAQTFQQQVPMYSMPQNFSALPAVSDFQTPTYYSLGDKIERLNPRSYEPGHGKAFKRTSDLTRHEKTYSQPGKFPVEACMYHEYGSPTEK
jgi:hypothetical protein